jgi:hypothetical protein
VYNATAGKPKMVSGSKEKPNETDRCNAGEGAPIFVTNIPPGYRDWRLISVAHEEGNFHSFSAVLANDLAIQASREGKVPFPDGAIIAALHYRHVPSDENNKVFGQAQSFVPGSPTNIQLMVKDTKMYTAIATLYRSGGPLPLAFALAYPSSSMHRF